MKSKIKLIVSVVLLVTLISSLFIYASCDKEIYTKVSRAKELVREIDKIPSSYSEIEQGVNTQNKIINDNEVFASASTLNSVNASSRQVTSTDIEIEDVDDFTDLKYSEEIIDSYYIYHGDSVYTEYDYNMVAVNIIKYYKDVALNTVRQLSVWVEGARQKERKFYTSVGGTTTGAFNYFSEKPAFRISYDTNVDMVTLECKGKNWGGYELYIKAFCSYNSEGKVVISALMQFLSGPPSVPQMDIINIHYVEDEYMAVERRSGTANWYDGTLSKEKYYKVYDELYTKLNPGYWIADLKTGNTFSGIGQHWQGSDWGTRAEYFTKLNDLIVIASLYETVKTYGCQPKYTEDSALFSPYDKRVEELFVLDKDERTLAVIDTKKAWISTSVTQSQRQIIENLFDIQQYADVSILGFSGLKSVGEFVESTIENNNVTAISAKELFAIMDEATINRRNQIADNEIFALLDINIIGTATLNTEMGEIDLSNISAVLPQSILLTEGAEYSLVVALKGSNELIDVCSSQVTYTGQNIELQLANTISDELQLGMDDYVVVVYLARKLENENIRLSNFYTVAAEVTAQYTKTWQEVVEEETRYKTLEYTYEIVASEDSIIVSQYKMIRLSPKY